MRLGQSLEGESEVGFRESAAPNLHERGRLRQVEARPWEGAYELWLVYLEEVERTAGDDVNLSNVYNRGAQDTMIKRAMERLPNAGKRIFRPGGGGGDGDGDEEPKWNGSFNPKSTATCLTFNLGKKQHPANCLNEKGGCKFNHACDAYVSDTRALRISQARLRDRINERIKSLAKMRATAIAKRRLGA